MALCFSVTLGLTQEKAEIKPDDPRWALVEFWAKKHNGDDKKGHPPLDLNLEELKKSRALIDDRTISEDEIISDKDYFRSKYQNKYQNSKIKIKIEGNWAVIYNIDVQGRIKPFPEIVHRKDGKWKADFGATRLVAVSYSGYSEQERWLNLARSQKKDFSFYAGVISLSKWLKEELEWTPIGELQFGLQTHRHILARKFRMIDEE